MGLKDGPLGYMHVIDKSEQELPNPVTEHVAESRWQSCDCKTCQRKRLMLDGMPGKRFDWYRYRKNSDWGYGAIFYLGD